MVDAAFVLGSCSVNESRVENKSVFWGATTCLQGSWRRIFSGKFKSRNFNPINQGNSSPTPSLRSEPQAVLGLYPTSCQPTAPRSRGKASNVAGLETWSLCWALGITDSAFLSCSPVVLMLVVHRPHFEQWGLRRYF